MIKPALVLHGDWGTAPSKRWIAKAVKHDGTYEVDFPSPAGDLPSLLPRTVDEARGQVMAGFDFPIGVPMAWARKAGVADFLEALPAFGQGEWNKFYEPAADKSEITVRRPFYPKRPGGTRRIDLWQGLRLQGWHELYRKCELAREGRSTACPLFWILGGQQVGRAAIVGWRDVLKPAVRAFGSRIRVWPFSGSLSSFTDADCIVAETYPADACLQIDLCAPGRGWSKRSQNGRADQCDQILRTALDTKIALSDRLRHAVADGFGNSTEGEDAFDAVVGLIAMMQELAREEPGATPADPDVRTCEGWIFGQPPTSAAAA